MSDYFSIRSGVVYLTLTSIFLSGCSSSNSEKFRRRDLTAIEQNYSDRVSVHTLSQKDRYDLEKQQNKEDDLIFKINPSVKKPFKDVQSSLDGLVSFLPKSPKIKSNRIVWKMSWEEMWEMFTYK